MGIGSWIPPIRWLERTLIVRLHLMELYLYRPIEGIQYRSGSPWKIPPIIAVILCRQSCGRSRMGSRRLELRGCLGDVF